MKRAEYRYVFLPKALRKHQGMIGSAKYPVPKTNRWANNNIWLIWVFRSCLGTKLFKVDTIGIIMGEFESMHPPLHILIIISPHNHLVEGKSRYKPFIVLAF